MAVLQRLNVQRVTDDAREIELLRKEGFVELVPEKPAKRGGESYADKRAKGKDPKQD